MWNKLLSFTSFAMLLTPSGRVAQSVTPPPLTLTSTGRVASAQPITHSQPGTSRSGDRLGAGNPAESSSSASDKGGVRSWVVDGRVVRT